MPNRLYLDNAATSFPKPREVGEAMGHYARELGASAGRGQYAEAVQTRQILDECRRRLCRLFNGERVEHFVLTFNCTDGLNLAIKGLVDPAEKGHAICTCSDHNSVLRPIQAMVDMGWLEQTRVPIDPASGLVDPEDIRRAITPATRFIAIAHASNVTGAVQPIRTIGKIAREAGIPLIVDAAQSAGHLPIDVQADCLDLLAGPGHKGLLGPQGTGFLYIRPGLEKILRPLKEGGTGSVSDEPRQPDFMPDKYECGSHNAVGIAGLGAGLDWIAEQTVAALHERERSLIGLFLEGISDIEGLTYFGPRGVRDRVGVFSIRIEGYDPAELSAVLEEQFGILTRSGIHCAPLAHQAIGTAERGGTTRFSFGPFISAQDVQYAADALAQIAMNRVASGA